VNNQPAQPVATGVRQVITVAGRTFPQWVFNNVDLSPAMNPANKVFFSIEVEGIFSTSNVWSHAHPRWVFNNGSVLAATRPPNTYSFRAFVEGMTSFPNVWVHGAESRTIFPLMDVPARSGENCS